MGKAAKKERQKNKIQDRQEQVARAQSRAKQLKALKIVGLVLIIPIVILSAQYINEKTNKDHYTAKITVAIDGESSLPNNGVMEVELENALAPKSVKHFVQYASNGYYDGLEWFRVVNDFVIQTGDPTNSGTGNLGDTIVVELPVDGYKSGDLAWAKTESEPAGTAGSQFFVVTGKDSAAGVKNLNRKVAQADGSKTYQYGFIGRILKGLAAAQAIEDLAPTQAPEDPSASPDKPTKKAIVKTIEIYKNGNLVKRGDFTAPTTTTSTTTPLGSSESTQVPAT